MKKNRIIVAAVLTLSLMLSAIPAFAETIPAEKLTPADTTPTTTAGAITTTTSAITTTTPAVTTTTPAIQTTPDAVKVETLAADVSVNSLNIKVNDTVVAVTGESYALADGTEVPFSLLYKGTTYLPMRKVGELVGKDITFDNTTKTASINSTTAAVVAPAASTATAKAGGKEAVTFSVNSLNISVDAKAAAKVGESFALADGSEVPFSLLYKGTTYLPMRKVGELVGKDIAYDNTTKTAQIKDENATTAPEEKTPVADKVAAYANHKNVPDFGALTTLKLAKTETVDGLVVYSYDFTQLTDAQLAEYEAALVSYGFEVVENAKLPSYMQAGVVCTNKADKTTLYMGSSADTAKKVYTFYIAIEQGK